MGGITCNAEGFAGETGVVNVLEGGERDTNDLLSCSHYPLKGLAAGRVAGAIPHSDTAHLAPVVCLISVADETHHSRVIRKFNEAVGVV